MQAQSAVRRAWTCERRCVLDRSIHANQLPMPLRRSSRLVPRLPDLRERRSRHFPPGRPFLKGTAKPSRDGDRRRSRRSHSLHATFHGAHTRNLTLRNGKGGKGSGKPREKARRARPSGQPRTGSESRGRGGEGPTWQRSEDGKVWPGSGARLASRDAATYHMPARRLAGGSNATTTELRGDWRGRGRRFGRCNDASPLRCVRVWPLYRLLLPTSSSPSAPPSFPLADAFFDASALAPRAALFGRV